VDEHGVVAVVVGLGEERLAVHREDHLFVDVAADTAHDHARIRDARLLRIDALLPQPKELLAIHVEAEIVGILGDAVERERDAPDVTVRGHRAC
jgi:hypothetical protein